MDSDRTAEPLPEESARRPVAGATAAGEGAVAVSGGIGAGRDVHLHLQTAKAETGPDEETLLRAYLNRVIEQTEILPLSVVDRQLEDGHDDLRLKLPAVYTALLTRSARFAVRRDRAQREDERKLVSALEQLDRHRKLVLLGDPGSGKSTFVNFVALCLAGEALGRTDANLARLTAPLPGGEGSGEEEAQPWSRGQLLPVRVVLRDFAAKGLPGAPEEEGTASRLWEFLRGQLVGAGHGPFFAVLQRELLAGRGLVLLDGLDEVPEASERRRQIREVVADFARGIGKSRVLVTGRTYAYQEPEARLQDFAVAVLAPFSRDQIGRFVGLWYEHQVVLKRMEKEQAEGRGELLRKAIFASDRLLSLAERPLLLTLMASLHALRGGDLPERREQLYEEAVKLLLSVWEKVRARRDGKGELVLEEPSLAAFLDVNEAEVRRALEKLAFSAHQAQTERVGTADVPEWQLVESLVQLKRDRGGRVDERKLLEYLENRAGLLLARGRGMYTFPHRTFQEYLSACHLMGADTFPDEVAKLGRVDPDRWREVVLLVGAKAGRAAVWYLAEALCERQPGEAGAGPKDEWGTLLAAQAVAETADLSRVGRHGKRLEQLRQWMLHLLRAEHFPARERATAGKALAKLGDLRFDKERWSLPVDADLGFVEIPAGLFSMGSEKEDPEAEVYEAPRHEVYEAPRHEVYLPKYWMAKYPVTVDQYRAFVKASGRQVRDRRSLEGPANHPVVYVSWEEALAYCRWLEERLREIAARKQQECEEASAFWTELTAGRLRAVLPSEAEWEKAARGTDGRTYPWGKEPDANRASFDSTRLGEPSSVGAFPGGASPYGCEEMSGNVWEWTRSVDGAFPYVAEDGREVLEASARNFRVVRGGAFGGSSRVVRCACRFWVADWYGNLGFRVVLSPFPS